MSQGHFTFDDCDRLRNGNGRDSAAVAATWRDLPTWFLWFVVPSPFQLHVGLLADDRR